MSAAAPEFSRPIEVARLGRRPSRQAIAADAGERAALARRFDLLALERLEAEVELRPLEGGAVRIEGALAAEAVQACVVSLEPVASEIRERFSLLFAPTGSARELLLDPEAELAEPIEEGRIDIGEAVAQQLALALDPYPRAPGARLPAGEPPEGGAAGGPTAG